MLLFHKLYQAQKSKAGIYHVNHVVPRPGRPVATRLRHDVRQFDLVGKVALDEVEVHALGRVPCDVAVEGPDTRAVGAVISRWPLER